MKHNADMKRKSAIDAHIQLLIVLVATPFMGAMTGDSGTVAFAGMSEPWSVSAGPQTGREESD